MEPDQVLTVADTRAQHVIVSNIRTMFPGIRLVGEEDEEDTAKHSEEKISLQDVPPLASQLTIPAQLAESLTLADTCLWIDPLDGTIEFVRNNVHNVCVLIGIAVQDRPVAGVVLQPFVGGDDGMVTYGAVGVGVFGDRSPVFADPPVTFTPAMEPKHAADPHMKASMGRIADAAPQVLSQGAGQMLLKVLRGETSVFVQGSGASRWDTCANEALLMAVGGTVTDLEGRPYIYKQGAPSYVNAEGLIAARTEELHARVRKAFLDDATQQPDEKRARKD